MRPVWWGLLVASGMTVATADSLTGGTLSALLWSVRDASRSFRAGLAAPLRDLAALLGAPPNEALPLGDLPVAGAAAALARALRARTGADLAIAVVGGNGSDHAEPRGESWVAVAVPDGRILSRRLAEDLDLGPGRDRERAIRMALQLAAAGISSMGEPGGGPTPRGG